LTVTYAEGVAGDGKAQQPRLIGECKIGRNAAARRRGHEMKAADPEMVCKRAQILRADASIVAIERRRVDVATARIADHAIAGLGEYRLLIAPDETAAGRRMQ